MQTSLVDADNLLVENMTNHHVRKADITVLIGKDSLDLLHSVTTQNVSDLDEYSCVFASILQSNGRMIDRILIMNLVDQIALIHLDGCAETSRTLLSKSVSWKQEVRIIPLDEGFSSIWVYGVPDSDNLWTIDVDEQIYSSQILNMNKQIVVHLGPDVEIEKMESKLIANGSIMYTDESIRLNAIENGMIGGKIIREFQPIPLEVGLESDISFTKGCYTGQEIIARMDAREALARTLVTISSDSLLDVGNHKIVGGGKLVVFDSVADSLQYTSLGLIHPDFAESGNEFNLDEINCTVVTKW